MRKRRMFISIVGHEAVAELLSAATRNLLAQFATHHTKSIRSTNQGLSVGSCAFNFPIPNLPHLIMYKK